MGVWGGCWRSFQWSAFRGSSARKGSLFRLRYKKGNGKMSFLVFGRVTKTLNNGEWCGITVFKGCENLKLRFGTIGRSLQVPLGDKPCLTGWGGDQTRENPCNVLLTFVFHSNGQLAKIHPELTITNVHHTDRQDQNVSPRGTCHQRRSTTGWCSATDSR